MAAPATMLFVVKMATHMISRSSADLSRGKYRFWVHLCIVPIIGTMKKAIHSTDYRKLIEWLKSAREARGWGMRELGERIEEPHTFVQKVESMERRLDVYEYVQYCLALGINPADGLKLMQRSRHNR